MKNRDLESLCQELFDSDEKERQERKLLFSRRWFVRALAGSAAGGLALGVANVALPNDPGCDATHENRCVAYATNVCNANDSCLQNICPVTNECGPGQTNSNTCVVNNQCSSGNICDGAFMYA